MILTKIISGGQTGADLAGLVAARNLQLQTGGMMPKGFINEAGQQPSLAEFYGMTEHLLSDKYPPRTEWNVANSDGTLIFGDANSRGCRLTTEFALVKYKKPLFVVPWGQGMTISQSRVEAFRRWLESEKINVLNVAGNRESNRPGIYKACYDFLIEALS